MAEQRVRSVFQDLYPPDQPAEMEMRAQLKRIVEAVACQAIFLGAPFCSVGAAASQSGADGPLKLTTSQLRVKIDQASAAAEKPLSLEARAARQRSLTRFYNATAALCGAQDQCLHNEYYNYLAQVPRSVYRVDGHLVYETGVYGLLWADERLQQQDPARPFTWDLRVTWPLIDEPGDPSGPMGGRAERALADEVHARMTNWVAGLWMLSLDVHLESLGRCYVSARLTSSWYSDGAHPNEDFEVFNWLLPANRRLTQADLFRDDSDWRRGLLGLIESASAPLPTASVTMTWPPGSIMGTLRRPRGSR